VPDDASITGSTTSTVAGYSPPIGASGRTRAVLPTWMVGEEIADGRLRTVLTGWEPPTGAISAVYPTRRNLAPRTRAVIDFFVDEFRLDPVISDYGEG